MGAPTTLRDPNPRRRMLDSTHTAIGAIAEVMTALKEATDSGTLNPAESLAAERLRAKLRAANDGLLTLDLIVLTNGVGGD